MRNGNCSRDSRPCCACKQWNSGWKIRKYNAPTPDTPEVGVSESDESEKEEDNRTCSKRSDSLAQNICSLLKDNGLCWAKATKSQCWTTCEVCDTSDLKDTGDLETKYDGSFTITINAGNSAVVTSTDIKKVYIGQWSNSRYSGAGYLINNFYDNDSYLGTFKDGNFQGKGTYNFGSGDVYTGGFHKNSF